MSARTIQELLPDTYRIYKKAAESYDDLGLPVVVNTPISFEGSIDIPCRLQEYRSKREYAEGLDQDIVINYQEIIAKEGSPLYMNHIIVVNSIEYEVITVKPATFYEPYVSAFIVNLGEAQVDGE